MIDYALPTMMAEKALKAVHDAMLMKRYDEALRQSKDAFQHLVDIQFAIKHEQKLEDERQKRVDAAKRRA